MLNYETIFSIVNETTLPEKERQWRLEVDGNPASLLLNRSRR